MANTDQFINELRKSLSKLATQDLIRRLVSLSFFGRLFSVPILGAFVTMLLGLLVKEVFVTLEQLGYNLYINFQKAKDADDFVSAANKNEEIQNDSAASEADKEKAKQELLEKARKLIRYN